MVLLVSMISKSVPLHYETSDIDWLDLCVGMFRSHNESWCAVEMEGLQYSSASFWICK